MKIGIGFPAIPIAALLLISAAFSALTYPGCPDAAASDFAVVPLLNYAMDKSVQEPLKMDFAKNPQGDVDVYFTQRYGKLRKYDGTRKSVVNLADFAFADGRGPSDRNSAGLIGIALDPGFGQNHWIYLYIGLDDEWRVSRFLVDGDKVDPGTERPIFRFDPGKATTHVAGDLRFDDGGNLWVTVAENEARDPSANTGSYLGKILRIKPMPVPDAGPAPDPGAGTTYQIPSGNLYPPGTAKTLPEIYVMGVRNPYTLALDPVRKGIAWGDVGPDGFGATEEFNFTTRPGNFGYPFWAGNQRVLEPGHGTPAAPTVTSPENTGLRNLKPAVPPIYAYNQACAVTGPIYHYDPSLRSGIKFPPHFDGKWIVGDFNHSWIDVLELDQAGDRVLGRTPFLALNAGDQLNKPLELRMGPDGALYVINYSGYRTWNARTGILRVEYHGECRPASTQAQVARTLAGGWYSRGLITIDAAGPHEMTVVDPSGRTELRRAGSGPAEYDLSGSLASGIHIIRIRTAEGSVERKIVR